MNEAEGFRKVVCLWVNKDGYREISRHLFDAGVTFGSFISFICIKAAQGDPVVKDLIKQAKEAQLHSLLSPEVATMSRKASSSAVYDLLKKHSPFDKNK